MPSIFTFGSLSLDSLFFFVFVWFRLFRFLSFVSLLVAHSFCFLCETRVHFGPDTAFLDAAKAGDVETVADLLQVQALPFCRYQPFFFSPALWHPSPLLGFREKGICAAQNRF